MRRPGLALPPGLQLPCGSARPQDSVCGRGKFLLDNSAIVLEESFLGEELILNFTNANRIHTDILEIISETNDLDKKKLYF